MKQREALTARELHDSIKEFAISISNHPLGLAYHRPHPNARHTNCIANAVSVKERYGGQVCYGWYFIHRLSIDFGNYLVATHHAVWHNPDNFMLFDVTPFHPEERHQPITENGDLLFLIDDNAKPFHTMNNLIVPLPLRFHAIKPESGIQNYVAELQRKEYETYNQAYGSSFP